VQERIVTTSLLVLTIALLATPALVLAQAPAGTLADTPTPTTTPTPTATPVSAGPLQLASIEPGTVINNAAHTLSIYGSGFTTDCVVRIAGYGLLGTTIVNATALTAQLPPGISAGTYTVEVSDGVRLATLANALKVKDPDPEPEPDKPAPPGQPRLAVRNYTVEPAQVNAGDEFAVTIEIYNNGSRAGENTMAVFPGGTFLPVGDKGHMIWQLHINHTAIVSQRLRAPDTLSSGVQQVRIELSANDWEGNHFEFPTTVPVEVIGKSTSTGYSGAPKVVIEDVTTEPAILVPGDPFSLTLRLANRGSRTAVNVFTTAASGDMAIPASGSDTVSTPKIGIEETVTVTLPLMLGSIETGGRQSMAIALAYSDYDGGSYSDQQNIGVDINTSLIPQPQILIDAYATVPVFLAPGDTFTLSLQLANVGGGDASRLTLALGGQDGAALAPFIPLKSGNVLFVEELAKGERITLERQLVVDGSAEARAYSLPIALAYDDPRASRTEEIQRLSIIIRKRPELQVSFYRKPDMLSVGMPAPVALEIINVGRNAINVAGIEGSSPQMEIQEDGLPFIGPLDPGGSAPLDLLVTPSEGGTAQLLVTVSYRDDFNQIQVISDTLELDVIGGTEDNGIPGGLMPGSPDDLEDEAPETFLQKLGRAIRGFFGFGS